MVGAVATTTTTTRRALKQDLEVLCVPNQSCIINKALALWLRATQNTLSTLGPAHPSRSHPHPN